MAAWLGAMALFRSAAFQERFGAQALRALGGLMLGTIPLTLVGGLHFLRVLLILLALWVWHAASKPEDSKRCFQAPVYYGGFAALYAANWALRRGSWGLFVAVVMLSGLIYLSGKVLIRSCDRV